MHIKYQKAREENLFIILDIINIHVLTPVKRIACVICHFNNMSGTSPHVNKYCAYGIT